MKGYIKKHKMSLWLIVLILEGMLMGCSSQKEKQQLNLMDYIQAEYVGTQGHFQVTLIPDADKIQEKYEEIKAGKSVIDAVIFSKFMNGIELEYDNNEALYKNGDKIHVTFHWDEQAAEECMYKAESEGDFEIRVSEGKEEIDPFEGLEVVFSGMNGEGWVDFDTDACHELVKEEGLFQLVEEEKEDVEDEDGGYMDSALKNGDKITIEFIWVDNGKTYRKEDIIISKAKKEYTVEGLGEYVKTVKQEDFKDFNQHMLEYTKEQVRSWSGGENYIVTPYQYYYYYNMYYMRENGYVGIYKVENTEIRNEPFYFISVTFPLYRQSTGELAIDSYIGENEEEMFFISPDDTERCVINEEELSDLLLFLERNAWLDEGAENYKIMEVK